MQLLNYIMIFSGSALMVYNIIRYGLFVKSSIGLEKSRRNTGLLIVPLVLLIFFLIGYVVIGITLEPNLLVAAILLGGSIFVFLLLVVMFSIVRNLRETDRLLAVRYEEMKEQVHMQGDKCLSVFLVNLSKDEVEDRAGNALFDSDLSAVSYTELLEGRLPHIIRGETVSGAEEGAGKLSRVSLIQNYNDGQTSVSVIALVRNGKELPMYVRFQVVLTKMPVSGDIVAMITEKKFNRQIVRDRLLDTVLLEEYDRISYLIDGTYHELVSNDTNREMKLLPPTDGEDTDYETLYYNYILPATPKDRRKEDGPNPLRLSVIDKALSESDYYDVDAPFVLNGETRFKHIRFFCVNREAKFYLMLLSDSTVVTEEQMDRNRRLQDALDEAVAAHQDAVRTHQEESAYFAALAEDLTRPVEQLIDRTDPGKARASDETPESRLAAVHREALTFRTYIRDLMTMSRIQSGTLVRQSEPANVRACAEGLVNAFAEQAGAKGIRLTADTDRVKHPNVCCDKDQLRRVLSRLLTNALAFAPEGSEAVLSVSEEETAKTAESDYVFAVRNAGVPMPEEVLEHIFELESWKNRADRDQKELPGAGIGMVVARAFVEAMGGEISAHSSENGDTEFRFKLTLPVTEQENTCDCPQQDGLDRRNAFRVLLADDNEINREVGQLLLTAEGYEVELAENGREAVDRIVKAEPDRFGLVLMDVQMPVLDGYGAAKEIRALPDARAQVPILAMTANTDPEDVKAALDAGMDGHLAKPIDVAALRAALEKLGIRAE